MAELFLTVVNMSFSASWLVAAVLLARFALKKASKWVNVLLWGLVAMRLLLPISIESALSLIPSAQVVSPHIMMDPTPQIHTGIEAVNSMVNPVISGSFAPHPGASANPLQIWIPVLALIWLLGMAAMLCYSVFSYLRLRRRVRTAIRAKPDIYLSEYVTSPFVLGLFRPRIYLPYHMSNPDRAYVITHERTHIRRRDHWWKPLGFTLLTVHWFNPLMWVAYGLLCQDIELACDERVIRNLSPLHRAGYSQALLNCTANRFPISACPLAFGETGIGKRVRRVLTYKKPGILILSAAMLLCALVAVCFLTDPKMTLPFMEELVAAESAQTSDFRGEQILRRELNPAEREELSYRLRDLAHIERYESDTGNSIIPLYSLTAELEGLGTVTAQGVSWDGTKVLLIWQDQQYLVEDPDFAQYLSRICSGGDTEAAAKQLSLNDMIILSQKGFDLTWSDFKNFLGTETGSGLYIRRYEINDAFFLLIGGGSLEEPPMYIRLCAWDSDLYVDIRQGNADGSITDFISRYGDGAPENALTRLVLARLDVGSVSLFSVTSPASLESLEAIFDGAEWIGYDPQTYYLGPTVVLTYSDGTELVAELDLYDDGCLIDGKYYDYGPGMDGPASINATPQLLAAFGLTDWPQAVKAAYPEVFTPQPSATIPPANGLFPPDDQWESCTIRILSPGNQEAEIPYPQTLPILELLNHVQTGVPHHSEPSQADYTLFLRFPAGEEYEIVYAGNGLFWLYGPDSSQIYTFTSIDLANQIVLTIADSQ